MYKGASRKKDSMVKILLACSAGMSTSLLVNKMRAYATSKNIEATIEAKPVIEAKRCMNEWDIVLLGPQVRYMCKDFSQLANDSTCVDVIPPVSYGTMNGEAVVQFALEHLQNTHEGK